MDLNFFQEFQTNGKTHNGQSHKQEKSWQFTYLGGNFHDSIKSPPANSFSLVETKKGRWVQIVALPRNSDFPIVGVAVGTYMLVLGTTNRGGVRLQVIGKQVTLARAIAQEVYVRPLYFTN
jgi:hypothetical protein